MRKLLVLAFLMLAPAAWGQSCTTGQNFVPVSFAKETLTVGATAVPLTATVYAPQDGQPSVTMAYCSVETGAIRFWVNGSIPTAAVGIPVATGSYITVCQTDVRRFQAIRQTVDATLSCTYSRPPQ